MSRGRIVGLLCAVTLAAIGAACVPVAPPPPSPPPPTPPSPPTPAPGVPPVPPVAGAPAGSPTLTGPTPVVTGLNRPWDIAFLPGATGPANGMLFTENDARTVKLFTGSSTVTLLTEASVDISGEGGMMGVAVHPSWPTTKQVFVCYSTTTDNRVVRYDVTTDASGVPTTLVTPGTAIVTGMLHAGFHNGCRIRFQPGTTDLFVTMGDAGSGPSPQSNGGLNGKVLRVDTNGIAVAGNASGQRWYTKGHRNPQGITFDPAGGNTPWSAEHGPDINDEVNKLVNGGNAGWDPTNGADYDQLKPMTDLGKFPGAMLPQWRSGDPACTGTSASGTPGCYTIAPSGLTFVEARAGETWGSWANSLILSMLKNQELRLLRVDASRSIVSQTVVYSGGERLRVPVEGPDGKLYVATDANPGRIFVLDPS